MKGFLYALLVLIIYIIVSTIPYFVSDYILADESLRKWYYLFSPLLYFVFFVLARFIFFKDKFKIPRKVKSKISIIPLLIILALLIRFWTNGIQYIVEFHKIEHIQPLDFTGVPIPYFFAHGITTIILIPIIEELVFRGIILEDLLERNYNTILAIFLSSFFFAIIHFKPLDLLNSLPNVLGAFLFGLIAGWLYQRTRNLYYVILLHWIANLYSFLFSDIYFAEYWNFIIDLNAVLYLSLIVISLILSYFVLNRVFKIFQNN